VSALGGCFAGAGVMLVDLRDAVGVAAGCESVYGITVDGEPITHPLCLELAGADLVPHLLTRQVESLACSGSGDFCHRKITLRNMYAKCKYY
jgi:hypothetical protein